MPEPTQRPHSPLARLELAWRRVISSTLMELAKIQVQADHLDDRLRDLETSQDQPLPPNPPPEDLIL
jgi:uncharacterized coiled-coil protein SlyX